MTATEELRYLLNKRGVDWDTEDMLSDYLTTWVVDDHTCAALEIDGKFSFSVGHSSPSKAIEVTLGHGECHDSGLSWWFECSECGHGSRDWRPKFCPNCGRKVKQ